MVTLLDVSAVAGHLAVPHGQESSQSVHLNSLFSVCWTKVQIDLNVYTFSSPYILIVVPFHLILSCVIQSCG